MENEAWLKLVELTLLLLDHFVVRPGTQQTQALSDVQLVGVKGRLNMTLEKSIGAKRSAPTPTN